MSWLSRLKNSFHPHRLDEELAEETRDHIERRTADLQRRGLDEAAARRQASLSFGNATSIRENCREVRLSAALEGTLQDLRYAVRGLLRSKAFAMAAVGSLGLSIGANTAIYSIVDAALLRKLPLPQPDRLVAVTTPAAELFSYLTYERLSRVAGGCARLILVAAANRVEAQVSGSDDRAYEEVTGQFVSPNWFEVLGVPPALGSVFSPVDDHYPSPRAVVVLSFDYWQRRFGGDPSILGRRVVVDRRPYSVLGVAGKGFSGTEPGKFVDVWLPVTVMDAGVFTTDSRLFRIMGRLEAGVGRERLAARLQPEAAGIMTEPGANGAGGFQRSFTRPLWILWGVSFGMLVIANANVASLLLARSSARAGEMALRVSLGAGRTRLVRQLLTESLLISSIAGLVGWVLASGAAPVLVTMVSTKGNPVQLSLALNGTVLWFCAGTCAVSAMFFGLMPAWQATKAGPISELRHFAGQAGRLRAGRVFLGMQVAFAFCLVLGGAGFLFSLHNLTVVHTGFDARGVAVLSMVDAARADRQFSLMQQMQMRLGELPQVQGAASAWMAVFSGARRAQRVALPGRELTQEEETFYRVSPGYFAALRTPLLSGRDFTWRDNDDEPVPTVVNRAFARRYFGAEAVLGREFRRDDGVLHQIVGVAADSHFGSLRNGPEAIAYMPIKPPRAYTLYLRSTLDVASVAKLVEREAAALGPGLRVRDVTTLESVVGSTIRTEQLLAGIGGAFALLGLLLAATGLFGLLNYRVKPYCRNNGSAA